MSSSNVVVEETFYVSHGSPMLAVYDSMPSWLSLDIGRLINPLSRPLTSAIPSTISMDFLIPCTRYEDVNEYEKKAPHAKRAHPHPDQFYPLHVAMGAAGANPKAELIRRSWSLDTVSYAS